MNVLSQRLTVGTAETSPTVEAAYSSENIFVYAPLLTLALDRYARLQVVDRYSALTGLPEHAFRKHVSLLAEPLGASSPSFFENDFTETLGELQPFYQPFFLTQARHLWSFFTRQSETSASGTITSVIRLNENSSAATTKSDKFLERLLELKKRDPLAHFDKYGTPDWDGYNAEPITRETIDAARSFLRMLPSTFGTPDIAPGSDGTIGLEWVFAEGPLRKLFIDVGPGQVWSAYWRRASGERGNLPHGKVTPLTKDDLEKLFVDLSV